MMLTEGGRGRRRATTLGDEALGLVEAEVEVHTLDGGAGRAFAKVVEPGHDHGLFGVAEDGEVAAVSAVAGLDVKEATV